MVGLLTIAYFFSSANSKSPCYLWYPDEPSYRYYTQSFFFFKWDKYTWIIWKYSNRTLVIWRLKLLIWKCMLLFSHSVVSLCDSMDSKHTRLPCPSPSPRACSNSCPFSRWCHPTILSSVIHFFSCLQSFPASGSFLVSRLFASGCQRIRPSASTSVLPINIQDWYPLRLTDNVYIVF